MAKYKTRSDINFEKLHNFNETIKANETNPDFDVIGFFMDTWYNKYDITLFTHCQKEFYKAIETPGKVQNYKINIDLKKAEQFIDLDTLANLDKLLFLKLAVKKRYFWQTLNISLETANTVFSLFTIEPTK